MSSVASRPTVVIAITVILALLLGSTNPAAAHTTLPAHVNFSVVDGDEPGEALITWDAVPGATGYSVRWMNVNAATLLQRLGGPWQDIIESIDFGERGEANYTMTLKNLSPGTVYAFGIGTKFGGSASPDWSGWTTLKLAGGDGTIDVYDIVQLQSAALSIANHAHSLSSVGAVPTHAGMTRESLTQDGARIARHKAALTQQLGIISGRGNSDRVGHITSLANRLITNVESIQSGRRQLLLRLQAEQQSRAELTRANSIVLFPAVTAVVDRQFYGLMTNLPEDRRTGSTVLTRRNMLDYSATDSLANNAVLGHTLLLVASLMQDPTHVARLQESFDSVAHRIDLDVNYLRETSFAGVNNAVLNLAEDVRDAGTEGDDYFERLEERLELVEKERALIKDSENLLKQLLTQVDALGKEAQGLRVPPIPTAPAVGTRDPGISDSEILFGQSAALTGPSAALGLGMQLGIQAAFKEVNDAGGVHGRQLRLVTRDDRYETDAAFAQTLRLIEDERVFGLIGAVGTPTSRAASPLARASDVPFVAPFTGAQLLRVGELTNVLNMRASYHQETQKMVELLAAAGKTKVAVLYQNDSYGVDGLTGVEKAAKAHGLELVASWYYRRNTEAVTSAAFRIADKSPEAVIIIGAYRPAARLIKKLREDLGSETIFMAVSFVGSEALAEELGAAGEGVYVTQVVPLPGGNDVPVLAEYRAALSGVDPDADPAFISLEGYLAGRLAIERLRACGADVSRECFLDVTGASGSIDIGGISLQYGPGDNQGSDAVYLTVINSEGDYELVDSIRR